MSRGHWTKIKRSKFFYVRMYRKAIVAIIVSQVCNIIFFLGIVYVHFNQPVRTFYATSGETPPIVLTPLATPNNSAEALLPPDPIDDEGTKPIPG